MKITLRKRDSVTSIVLFLFNILGEYKNVYEIKLSDLLSFIQYFDKSESSIRTGLSRMVKTNVLVSRRINNETVYELTSEGEQNIKSWNKGLDRFFKRYESRRTIWDNRWRFLLILDFNKSEYENLFILQELHECGLREINNVWLTPYQIPKDIISALITRDLKYICNTGVLEGNVNLEGLFEETFNLNENRKKYISFFEQLKNSRTHINQEDKGKLLPVLFELGWEFYDIVTSDPVLPKELLSSWEGDKIVEEMISIRATLFDKITDFFREKNV